MTTIEDVTSTAGPETARPRKRLRGGLVTIGTVGALLAAMGLTVLGLGAADNAVATFDSSSWLFSTTRSELARVNGITARVDTRMEVPGGRRHQMQVAQTDRLLILRDLNTGQVSSLDLATLQITATTPTAPGLGVSVALHDDAAFVVDAVQGIVRQLDPRALTPVGEPVRYPPGIAGGTFDGEGKLWVAVPSEGTVSAVTAADLPATPGDAPPAGLSPKRVETYDVAEPAHELVVSTLDEGVAVLDRTSASLVTVTGGETRRASLSIVAPGNLPARTSGPQVPVTVSGDRSVHVVRDGAEVKRFTVPGAGVRLSPAVAWAGRFYCADEDTGTVYSFDAGGQLVETIKGSGRPGPVELEVRENHLFINPPDSSTAQVVDDRNRVREVNKYANDVLGGDPPPAPPPPPPPKKPKVSEPGAPKSVRAAAGNASARVSWQPAASNGAEIIRYVVEGGGQTHQVGANQRALEITGLTNGETYTFAVHAVNARGDGPARRSNPVVPTAEVPDPPTSVTAEARPDGTVRVSWPEANGQGNKVARYAVTATSAGASAPAGESPKTELVVPAGQLEYGTQYAFTVTAVSEKGAGSKASPVSDTVVPFAAPDAPAELRASTVADRPGTVAVQWSPAVENGRPVTKYVVEAGGKTVEVTDAQATVGGLGDGQNVTVKVKAVNEAGAGAEASTTARTVAAPRITVTGSSADATSVTVTFTVDAGGGRATCTAATGGKTASGSCSSLRVTGLTPGTAYTVTLTASNAAGKNTATRGQTTDALYGIATCRNGSSGAEATYCSRDVPGERNGNEIFEVTQQDNSRQAGWERNGARLRAYCKKSGEEVYAYIYNNDKRSTWWVRVDHSKGRDYIPWAWLNLEGGDNINLLPTC
ncbi:fibronectin type III domain-containing protein [Micromonospora sp. WMMD980]|uniref:fibronectin type III domain-containing protein n=1 Tax=Micromonospora sp. WMMD980 TaxID=3016088 RepID=UPI002417F5D6|nr:fibronectin type III domain-containing protein [Micromonospora sp. WMMD980]MDG4799917.1 fibronectin type III domain-containing protein [Micromonospora sp. WMMD980]